MADVTRLTNYKKRASTSRRSKPHATIPSLVHEAQITTLINLAARLTGKAARLRMGRIGAWPGQIPLLLWLLEEDGVIQKELVERTNMEQSTVAEHLDRMERDGLVKRERGRDDRRKYRFYLTPKARLAARDLIGWLETGAELFTKGIPRDDLAVFTKVIRQIIGRLDEYIRTASARRVAPPRRPAREPKRAASK
jgi:DNA-binding MarR family transcriptional regulator